CLKARPPRCASCSASSRKPPYTRIASPACRRDTPTPRAADKFVFAIDRESEMVGCADLIRGYPDPATAMLGLLLVSERYRREGIGSRAYALLERYILDWRACRRVRIGVVRSNAEVIPFWTRLGFEPTGEVKPYRYGPVASEIVVFQKSLPGTP